MFATLEDIIISKLVLSIQYYYLHLSRGKLPREKVFGAYFVTSFPPGNQRLVTCVFSVMAQLQTFQLAFVISSDSVKAIV